MWRYKLCGVLILGCILVFPIPIDPMIQVEFRDRTVCTVTFYTPCPAETDSTPYITASGIRVRPGICAVSRDLEEMGFTFGKTIYVEGLGLFEIQDRMHTRWTKRVDILVFSKAQARKLGKMRNIRVVRFPHLNRNIHET